MSGNVFEMYTYINEESCKNTHKACHYIYKCSYLEENGNGIFDSAECNDRFKISAQISPLLI